MSPPEREGRAAGPQDEDGDGLRRAPHLGMPPQRYGRYVGLLALVILVLITINTIVTRPTGAAGLSPGTALPPFAVPLALSNLDGDADIATHADDGQAGRVAACDLRGPRILNVCELYEHAPLVLALFVDAGSCPQVLGDMQTLSERFREVNFAAVALHGSHSGVSKLVRSRGLTFPVGIDSDGALAALYKVATCTQLTFALPGGTAQGHALLSQPAPAQLEARVRELLAASTTQGAKGSG